MKTLKDIESEIMADNGFGAVVCCSNDLKKSAIKDIEEYEKKIDNQTADLDNYEQSEHEAVINYIKEKFNMTEEDLK